MVGVGRGRGRRTGCLEGLEIGRRSSAGWEILSCVGEEFRIVFEGGRGI